MAIEKKLIHFGKLADFETQLNAGNILNRSIVFIQDAKKIWTHGAYYDCSEGGAKVYEWFYDGESKYVLLSQEEYDNIVESDIVVVDLAGRYSLTVSKSGKEFSEALGAYSLIGQLEAEGVKLYINISIEISTKVATITAREQEILTKTSQLENDSNFVSSDGLKTINGQSIVGEGDITIEGGSLTEEDIAEMGFAKLSIVYQSLSSFADGIGSINDIPLWVDPQFGMPAPSITLKTINGESILGSGDITISSGVTEEYLNNAIDEAIASAITTTLNRPV